MKHLTMMHRVSRAAVFMAITWISVAQAGTPAPPDRWGVTDADYASLDAKALTEKARVSARSGELQQAATAGDSNAAVLLGVARLYGLGIPKDERGAAKLLRQAAEAGQPRAMGGWGGILMYGTAGETADPVAGRRWLLRGAEQGNFIAMSNLAQALDGGLGGPADAAASAHWARRSAEVDHVLAMTLLAKHLYYGVPASGSHPAVPQDRAAAAGWLRRAAQNGDAGAMRNLGIMLFTGDGVPKNDAEGEKWLRAAVAAGDASAKRNLDDQLARRAAQEPDAERRYYETEYCASVAGAFKDSPLTRGWLKLAATWFSSVPEPRRSRLADSARLDARKVSANTAQSTAQAAYEKCKSNIASAEAAARAETERRVAARDSAARSYFNPYAPMKLMTMDRIAISNRWKQAKGTRDDVLAWDGYCVVATETLVAMTTRNPAAFSIDPGRHTRLVQEIRKQRDHANSRFSGDFKPEEQASMQAIVNQQRVNYEKGFNERRGSERDVVEFVKTQVFQCDDEFRILESAWKDASYSRGQL
jgi:TPR repeat protein